MKICLLSNTNCDLVISSLKEKHEVFDVEGYGQWISYALASNAELISFNPKCIILLLDGATLVNDAYDIKSIDAELKSTANYIESLSRIYSSSYIIVSTLDYYDKSIRDNSSERFDNYVSSSWDTILHNLSINNKMIIRFDLKSLIELHGRKSIYSDSMFYMGSIPYSVKGTVLIADELDNMIKALVGSRKKVLAVDLDNTLWGGVIGEDGPQNIVLSESNLGRAYYDAQKRIKEIANTGILLAIISKNNQSDADIAFDNNKFMVLKKSDFISIKCNWNAKSQNLIDLASELNIGLDSIVFLDDNPIEREEVKQNASGVCVADFPKDIANLPKTIIDIYYKYFWINSLTKEDVAKKQQYVENYNRSEEMKQSSSLEDYLLNLKIKIEINEMNNEQKERVVQLINKTNQFNTNTLRLDATELNEYIKNNGFVFVANVSDKYGDNGLVVIMLAKVIGKKAIIDNFLMSCRVMSRKIEDAFIFAIEEKLCAMGVESIEASYVKTEKNKPVENLYEGLGFEVLSISDNEKHYIIKLPNKNKPLLGYEWRS